MEGPVLWNGRRAGGWRRSGRKRPSAGRRPTAQSPCRRPVPWPCCAGWCCSGPSPRCAPGTDDRRKETLAQTGQLATKTGRTVAAQLAVRARKPRKKNSVKLGKAPGRGRDRWTWPAAPRRRPTTAPGAAEIFRSGSTGFSRWCDRPPANLKKKKPIKLPPNPIQLENKRNK